MSNAAKPPNQKNQPTTPPAAVPVLKVLLADSQAIYRVGIRKIFALEDDIRVVAHAETLGQTLAAASKYEPDIVLFEAAICPNPTGAIAEVIKRVPNARMIVITGETEEDDTVEYLRRGVRGIISRSVAPELLVKCVRKVAEGETWLDNQGVNWVIEAYRSQAAQLTSPKPKGRLTDKELLIVACVTQGMKNKEIASEVGTTEQVVKNYLRKIYDKLGVSDRLELALYCIHHRLLQGVRVPSHGGEPDSSKSVGNNHESGLPVTPQKS
ncbi:MAG TPA: response regulator transcription factor [Terriglobales bacterium]|jgi:DNA-binding NarL/FixJ family response regulator|nr:response regulator transcription factor [Terriglobales bacterium]